MKFDVGRTYMVSSPNGCSVYNSQYLIYKEIPAGGSRLFIAQESELQLDDTEAVVTEVRNGGSMLLGELLGKLPEWLAPLKAELTALLDGAKRYNLRYNASDSTVAVELAYPDIDGTAKTAVEAVMAASVPPEVSSSCGYGVTPHVVDYLLHDFTWDKAFTSIFPKANYPNGFALPADMPEPELLRNKSNIRGLFKACTLSAFPDSWKMEAATNIFETFQEMPNLETLPEGMAFENVGHASFAFTRSRKFIAPETLKLTNMTDAGGLFSGTTMTKLPESIIFANITQAIEMCSSCFSLQEISSQANFGKLSSANMMFASCKLTRASALRVLNTIPSYTSGSHPLTIGIHIDYQNDDEVLAAINEAENKGWALTVQWTGTPTAQAAVTYGLRKPPIYARVGEIERHDGTTERVLDWGHYVTDQSGYEEFRSVEAAREYFGLPEEDLTETE